MNWSEDKRILPYFAVVTLRRRGGEGGKSTFGIGGGDTATGRRGR